MAAKWKWRNNFAPNPHEETVCTSDSSDDCVGKDMSKADVEGENAAGVMTAPIAGWDEPHFPMNRRASTGGAMSGASGGGDICRRRQLYTSSSEKMRIAIADLDRITKAESLVGEERLFEAAELLRHVQTASFLTPKHHETMRVALGCKNAVADLYTGAHLHGSGWKKQGETTGKRNTLIYYKTDDDARLTCRIETPIEASLLIPLLSVLNEVDLYKTWMPSWSMPRMGVEESKQLVQKSRANQILQVRCKVPWPFGPRDVVLHALAVDDIQENNSIAIRMNSVEAGDGVPPPEDGVERVDFEGAMLFRPCPPKHVVLKKSRRSKAKAGGQGQENLILVSFKMFLDGHMKGVPQTLINFVTRTVIGSMWSMLMQVAEDVRDGKRPEHAAAIASKQKLYKWIRSRIRVMFEKIENEPITNEVTEDVQRFIAYLQS